MTVHELAIRLRANDEKVKMPTAQTCPNLRHLAEHSLKLIFISSSSSRLKWTARVSPVTTLKHLLEYGIWNLLDVRQPRKRTLPAPTPFSFGDMPC
ncbi:hypothetical protein CEXT_180581 [Caerostris extrusa]|uniref:Uncharacterized protein n=1 Tax=Caerostris extrusa TaxID=172846 RepID=A0AAV4XGD4_CAEEX|nr:hypothetical protein CEXT_180581 [Caerostris extrusa]